MVLQGLHLWEGGDWSDQSHEIPLHPLQSGPTACPPGSIIPLTRLQPGCPSARTLCLDTSPPANSGVVHNPRLQQEREIALHPSGSSLPAETKVQEGRPWPGFPGHAPFQQLGCYKLEDAARNVTFRNNLLAEPRT